MDLVRKLMKMFLQDDLSIFTVFTKSQTFTYLIRELNTAELEICIIIFNPQTFWVFQVYSLTFGPLIFDIFTG